jgi:pSer/pThr/pTyr-binding forkhead associated (FHA) protein
MERELKPGRLVIGRTPDNDLQIDSKFISRHHCQIVTQENSCVIEDLNSTNGTYVQSKRVRRYNLNDGDVVQLGKHEIMYIDERVPRSRGPDDVPEKPRVA